MATYLQGVQDFIPQIQPYQPDLNLFANVMQTKQTQYDNNWKALNKMYGTYYNAALTREDTAKSRDAFIKQAEFNLERISQLDLSLEQNVTQATQIFKPIYENKLLMKDMALTKNANYQKNIASSLKGSSKKEDRDMYWDDGVRAIDYQMQEFKNASADEAMGFGNVEYTRYVNVAKEARKLAKEAGISMETVDFGGPNKEWIVKTKNGEQVIEPLTKLFESELGNDPAIKAVAKVEAYLARKDYAYSNAAQFKGGESEAELKYLETQFNRLKQENETRYKSLRSNSNAYDAKIADLKKQVENKTAAPGTLEQIKVLEMNKNINDSVLKNVEDQSEELNEDERNLKNPYGDVKSLRWKVDNAMASDILRKNLHEAAEAYAIATGKQDIKANPYRVNEINHSFRMAEIASRNAGLERAARIRNQGGIDKAKIEAGTHYQDENGNIVPVEEFQFTDERKGDDETSDQINLRKQSVEASRRNTSDFALPYISNMVNLLNQMKTQGSLSDEDVSKILNYKDGHKVTLEQFTQQIQNNPDAYLRNKVGLKGLEKLKNNFDRFMNDNKLQSAFKENSEYFQGIKNNSFRLNDYLLFVKEDDNFRIESSKIIEQQLYKSGFKYAKYAFDEKGRRRTEQEIISIISPGLNVQNKITKSGYGWVDQGLNSLSESQKQELNNILIKAGQLNPVKRGEIPGKYNLSGRKEKQIKKEYLGKTFALNPNTGQSLKPKDFNYNEMMKAADDLYTNPNVELPSAPSISGSSTGMSQLGNVKYISVNLKGDTPNKHKFREMLVDLNKFDYKDRSKFMVSTEGTSELAFENFKKSDKTNDLGKTFMESLLREARNPKTKLGTFTVDVKAITARAGKAAIVIRPSAEFIKENTQVLDKDNKVTKAGIFTPEEAQNALANGVSYIMPSNMMNNSVYKSYFYDPIAMYLNSGKDKVYTATYPSDPNYKISFSKSKLGQEGSYDAKIQYTVLDANGKEVQHTVNQPAILGDNLVNTRDIFILQGVPQIKNDIITRYNYGGE